MSANPPPPGPQDYAFGMRTVARVKADILGVYEQLKRDYGDSVSFMTGPYRFHIFFHPDQVREVLVTNAKSLIRLPRVMDTFAQWNGKSLLIVEGEPWIRQRRLVQQGFQPSRLQKYGETMVQCAHRMSQKWSRDASNQGHLDVDSTESMTDLTLSIICRTMFDTDPGELSPEIAKAVATLSKVAFDEMQAPIRLPNWLPTRHNAQKKWAIGVLDDVVWKFVRERRADSNGHGDLLSILLNAVDDESGGSTLDDRQVRDEVMTLMIAGHDTTAAALEWLSYCIAKHPHVARRCHEEIVRAISDRLPTLADVERMPYLVATIKETLRLYPPAIGVFLRQAAVDVEIGGYQVGRKSLIFLSSYHTQRDERWFPEPERFDPERFLPDREDEWPTFAYFPFGAGPRVCIGREFAMNELALIAATLLKDWQVEIAPGAAETVPDVKLSLRPRESIKLRWTKRSARQKQPTAATG